MADLKKRFIALTEKLTLTAGDFIAVDNASGGTKKFALTEATSSKAGLMAAADKAALDGAVEDVADLKSDINHVSNVVYKTSINADDGLVPFHAKKDDVITIWTKDGSTFGAADHLRFYDANGTYLDYWGTGSGYGTFRTFTYNVNTEACYISILKSGSTTYDYIVLNNTSSYAIPNLNTFSPANFIAEFSAVGMQNSVPFYSESGDVITVKTKDGSAFTVTNIFFLDENKEQKAYWGLTGYNGERTFTVPSDKPKMYYIYVAGTAQEIIVINNTSRYNTQPKVDQKLAYNQATALFGGVSANIFNGISKIDGKYVSSSDGFLYSNADYSVTDYFPVYPNATYKLPYHASGSQIAFYNANKVFISGFVTSSDSFVVPNTNTIVYARWCGETSDYSSWGLYLEPIQKVINTTEGLLAGIIDASNRGIRNIIVTPGTYDIIAEYKAKYGSSYFANYATNYNGLANGYYDRGIWLDNMNITFQSGSKVTAIYEGDGGTINANVRTYFSAFAMGQNVTVDGLVLDAKNLRYGIHPDFHPTSVGRLEMRNCDLHHYKESDPGVNDNQAIGAGLDIHSTWIFENIIFRSDTSHAVFRIHNNVSSDAESKIVIKDCYVDGNGFIRLNSYSTSTKQTIAQVTGCSWVNPAVVGKETEQSNDNITMIAWNNETRS